MLEGLTITPETEADWLAERKHSLGASEAAAAMGVSPYESPIDLWQAKLGLGHPRETNVAMRVGKALEPLVLEMYEEETGVAVLDRQLFVRHPGYPFLTATIDGRCEDGRLVEVKTAGTFAKGWEGDEPDAIPDQYLVQLAQQMAVTGAEIADLAVLRGNQSFHVYRDIPRNEDLVAAVLEWGQRFWRCVETRTPPDWGRMDARALAVLHPGCVGEMEFSSQEALWVDAWDGIGLQLKNLEAQREDYKTKVLAAMGDHQFGLMPDGRLVKRFRNEVEAAERVVRTRAYTSHYFKITKGRGQ